MATKLVAYDLNAPGQDYSDLIDAIKGLGRWWHHLDSTWLVVSTHSAAETRDILRRHLDDNDELLVVDVSGDARSWSGFSERAANWLRDTWQ